jgi:hypothetical protein
VPPPFLLLVVCVWGTSGNLMIIIVVWCRSWGWRLHRHVVLLRDGRSQLPAGAPTLAVSTENFSGTVHQLSSNTSLAQC